MKRALFALVALISCVAAAPSDALSHEWASHSADDGSAQPDLEQPSEWPTRKWPNRNWDAADISALKRWINAAGDDALPVISTSTLDTAVLSGEISAIDEEATALALRLARMHLLGCSASRQKAGWNITDSDKSIALEPLLMQALKNNMLNTFFATLRPAHHDYGKLRAAYGSETDQKRRATIGLNMERWRWMPRSLGGEYVLVNAPMFEASLWRGGERISTWKIIVGKTSTPTPVFDTKITGVIINPWWEIPASIVRESVGALVRRNPARARARGYVWANGRYRQKPGPNNALGQMKLVMPNRFSVYMHDTPSKHLFEKDVRAFSHGCIRTGNAIGYAATLLEGVRSRQQVDAIVASRKTTTIKLERPMPLYIAYFTAATDSTGQLLVQNDLYRRDARMAAASKPGCGG